MEETRKLVYAMLKFLKRQLSEGKLSGECAEGVEVGIQCLEAAYNLRDSEPSLEVPTGLQEIFQQYLAACESYFSGMPLSEDSADASPEASFDVSFESKAAADTLKNEGNSHMSSLNFKEAVICYTKAIQLDPKNAVYYCNRAAASNKLGNYESAIQDCKTALKYDPSYSKAHGRLGLAYASLNQHEEAVKHYKRAVDLEPDNDTYKSNLKHAEEAFNSAPSTSVPYQNVDLATIFTNPNLLSVASQMLGNPSMQSMMSNILSRNLNQEGGGIDALFQASQQLAQHMETENPALVEQLRRHLGGEQQGPQNRPPGPPPGPQGDF
uniref:SGTA homodimerisation domain-containing protein n=1 Tax=Graphocephala atropunctata TaxID=36148 RepID=A0A1B6KFW2_9HEMI